MLRYITEEIITDTADIKNIQVYHEQLRAKTFENLDKNEKFPEKYHL